MTVLVALLIAAFAYLLLIPLEHRKEFDNEDAFWEWYTAHIHGVYLTEYSMKRDGSIQCSYRKLKEEKLK